MSIKDNYLAYMEALDNNEIETFYTVMVVGYHRLQTGMTTSSWESDENPEVVFSTTSKHHAQDFLREYPLYREVVTEMSCSTTGAKNYGKAVYLEKITAGSDVLEILDERLITRDDVMRQRWYAGMEATLSAQNWTQGGYEEPIEAILKDNLEFVPNDFNVDTLTGDIELSFIGFNQNTTETIALYDIKDTTDLREKLTLYCAQFDIEQSKKALGATAASQDVQICADAVISKAQDAFNKQVKLESSQQSKSHTLSKKI